MAAARRPSTDPIGQGRFCSAAARRADISVRSGGTATALITGAKGQLGHELLDTAPSAWRVIACGSGDLDVTDADAVNAVMEQERPGTVIQLAAYTHVDQAEAEAERAEAVNVTGAFN